MGLIAEVASDIEAMDDLDEFQTHALAHIRRLVACDIAAYDEGGPTPQDVVVVADPPGSVAAKVDESFAAHVHQNPLIAHHARYPDAPAARLSDFIGGRELHRLELYDLVYRPLSVNIRWRSPFPERTA